MDMWLSHLVLFRSSMRLLKKYTGENGDSKFLWVPNHMIGAIAYDTPIPGYGTGNTITLRLWRFQYSSTLSLT